MSSESLEKKQAYRARKKVLDLLRLRKTMKSTEIADELGISKQVAQRQLRELQNLGMVFFTGTNNATRWHPEPPIPDLDTHQEEYLGVSSIWQVGYLFHKQGATA